MTPSITQLVVNMVEQTPDLILKVMKERLFTDAGVEVSNKSIGRTPDFNEKMQDCSVRTYKKTPFVRRHNMPRLPIGTYNKMLERFSCMLTKVVSISSPEGPVEELQ